MSLPAYGAVHSGPFLGDTVVYGGIVEQTVSPGDSGPLWGAPGDPGGRPAVVGDTLQMDPIASGGSPFRSEALGAPSGDSTAGTMRLNIQSRNDTPLKSVRIEETGSYQLAPTDGGTALVTANLTADALSGDGTGSPLTGDAAGLMESVTAPTSSAANESDRLNQSLTLNLRPYDTSRVELVIHDSSLSAQLTGSGAGRASVNKSTLRITGRAVPNRIVTDFDEGRNLSQLGFEVGDNSDSDTSAQVINDPDNESNKVLNLLDEGQTGDDRVSISQEMDMQQVLDVEFDYQFMTDGVLKIFADDELLGSVSSADEAMIPMDAPAHFSDRFAVDPGLRQFKLQLTNVGDPRALLDNLSVTTIPEPTSLALLGVGVTVLAGGRRRRNAS
jgi:hypothetical protein